MQLTAFASEDAINDAWSLDGRTRAVSRGLQSADLVLIASGKAK